MSDDQGGTPKSGDGEQRIELVEVNRGEQESIELAIREGKAVGHKPVLQAAPDSPTMPDVPDAAPSAAAPDGPSGSSPSAGESPDAAPSE